MYYAIALQDLGSNQISTMSVDCYWTHVIEQIPMSVIVVLSILHDETIPSSKRRCERCNARA